MRSKHETEFESSDLLEVVAEGNLHTVLLPQHLAGHQGVENSRAGQRQAKISTEQPPVLCWFIKLDREERTTQTSAGSRRGRFTLQPEVKGVSQVAVVFRSIFHWSCSWERLHLWIHLQPHGAFSPFMIHNWHYSLELVTAEALLWKECFHVHTQHAHLQHCLSASQQLNRHTLVSCELWKASSSQRRSASAHLHEVCRLHGVQQADPQVLSFVVHGDHVEGYCFWHSEDDG